MWEARDGCIRLKRHEKQSRSYARRMFPEDFKALDGKIESWQDWLAEKYKKPEGYVNKNGVKWHYQRFVEKTGGSLVFFFKNEGVQEIFRCSLLYMREHIAELRETSLSVINRVSFVASYFWRPPRGSPFKKLPAYAFRFPCADFF